MLVPGGAARGQSAPVDANVTGSVNVDAVGTTYNGDYSQVPFTAGNVNLQGAIQFTGTNPWRLHTPNFPSDNRTSL